MKGYGHSFYRHLLAGKDDKDDVRRHEFILNSLLCGLAIAGCTSLIAKVVLQQLGDTIYHGNAVPHLCLLTVTALALWRLSHSRHHVLAAYLFLAATAVSATYLALSWSFELPGALLSCTVLIMVSGMVLKSRGAILVTISLILVFLFLGNIQVSGRLHPDVDWLGNPLQRSDCLDFGLALGVIGLVSWLANAEIDRSLQRAQESRRALQEERDSLEEKVAARTAQLEQAQRMRTFELQRFAEFGRVSAHLLHEVANPLTAAALHLELFDGQQSVAVKQARKNLRQLERYVNAARQQLKAQSQKKAFSVRKEVQQSLAVIGPVAERAGVNIRVAPVPPRLKLIGDPVKFNQLFTNLVANAIDAYAELPRNCRRDVSVNFTEKGNYVHCLVHDWAKGISKQQLPLLFDPFYTTKTATSRGLGIGLSLVKQTVEQEFGGSISVSSRRQQGTVFSIKLRLPPKPAAHALPQEGKAATGDKLLLAPAHQ